MSALPDVLPAAASSSGAVTLITLPEASVARRTHSSPAPMGLEGQERLRMDSGALNCENGDEARYERAV
jgi:hypothetical protein